MAAGEARVRRERLWVALALLVGLALSLAAWPHLGEVAKPDSYEYMRGGQSLWGGQGFKGMWGTDQVLFPPLYPILLGAVDRVLHRPVLAGRLVSLAASVGAIWVFYLLARGLCPGRPAVVGTWLLALLPLRIQESSMVMSESSFLLLVVAGVALYLASAGRPWVSVLCGLALGAAYLTRPEGFFFFALLIVGSVLALRRAERRAWLRPVLVAAAFVLVSLPYVVYLHAHTGRWELSGKGDLNLAIATARSQKVPWQQLKLLSSDDKTVVAPSRRDSPRAVARRVSQNGRRALLLLTEAVSPFLLASLGLGLSVAVAWWRPRGATIWPALAAWASPLLVLPIFWVQPWYLLSVAPLLILLAVPALRRQDAQPGQARIKVAAVLVACAVAWMLSQTALRIATSPPRGVDPRPLVAAMRRAEGAPGPLIGNGTVPKALAFDTGRTFLPLPWASARRVLRYADFHGASFLLLTDLDHPDLAALACEGCGTDRLIPVARIERDPRQSPAVLQLYRLRPAAKGPGTP